MTPAAQLNGAPINLDQITALALINYGHYTSMRVEEMRVRGLSLHLDRLVQDCRRLFDAQLNPDRVRRLVRHALTEAPRSVVVRVTVFDPELPLAQIGADAQPRLLITIRPATHIAPAALHLQSSQYCREQPAVKHVGLFGSLRQRRLAQRNGFDDVLFTDTGTTISEAATSNIGFLNGDRLVWPQAPCLAGVTMRLINQVLGAQASTAQVSLSELAGVDAVVATSAVVGVRPVAAIDGIRFPTEHPMISVLSEEYAEITPELV